MKLKKTALLTGLLLGIFGMSISCAFSDLPNTHWAYDEVMEMQEKGVISGYNDGTFRPQNNITREEFATILSKTLGLKTGISNIKFSDVDDSRWSKEYIYAVSDYLSGYEINGNNYFKPTESSIREDMAVAVVKVKGLEDEMPDYTVLDRFSDKDLISENVKKYVAIAVKNGIMNGNTNGTFNPKGSLTRAEITALMSNVGKDELTTEEAKEIINDCFKIGFLHKPNGDSGNALQVLYHCGFENISYSDNTDYSNTGIKYEEFEDEILNYVSKGMLVKHSDFKNIDETLYIRNVDGNTYCECKGINLVSASEDKYVYWVSFVCELYALVNCNAYVDIIKGENGKYVIDNIYNVIYMEEYSIKDKLSYYTNNIIRDMVIDDFNNDGYSEAFVFTSRERSEEEIKKEISYYGTIEYAGQLWFINHKGEVSEVSNGFSLRGDEGELLNIITIGNKKYLQFGHYWGNGWEETIICEVTKDNNVEIILDDGIYLAFKEDGNIIAKTTALDGMLLYEYGVRNCRTYKDYYFYIDGDEIREYGAIEISLDKLKEFDGAEEIINNITQDGEVITDILYRANNIININTEIVLDDDGIEYWNYTLKYDDNSIKDISSEIKNESGGGTYLKAIKPEWATYPTLSLKPSHAVSRKEMENVVEMANLSEDDNWFEGDFTENEYRFIDLQRFTVGDAIASSGYFSYETTSTYYDGKIDYSAGNLGDSLNYGGTKMALDERSWVEGVDGYGIGEKIKVTMAEWDEHIDWLDFNNSFYSSPEELCNATVEAFVKWKENGYGFEDVELYDLYHTLDNIYIINGYAKNDELWNANSRVKKLKLTIDNKEEYILELDDTNELQIFDIHYKNDDISKPIVAEFEILEVYKGNKYDDTAMSFLYTDVGNNIPWGGR